MISVTLPEVIFIPKLLYEKMNRNLQTRSHYGAIFIAQTGQKGKSMNEKIRLKNGKEYPLVIGGTSSTHSTLQLIFQIAEPVEDIVAVFEDSTATEQIKSINEDGSTLLVYDGYTVLGNPKSIDDHYLIIPEQYGEDGAVTSEAVYGRVAMLTLSQPGIETAVEHNRADIDFVAVMTGISL